MGKTIHLTYPLSVYSPFLRFNVCQCQCYLCTVCLFFSMNLTDCVQCFMKPGRGEGGGGYRALASGGGSRQECYAARIIGFCGEHFEMSFSDANSLYKMLNQGG